MPEAPQMESNTDTSITLVAIEDGEYNINGSEWQPSPVFEGLMPNTSYIFTQRIFRYYLFFYKINMQYCISIF